MEIWRITPLKGGAMHMKIRQDFVTNSSSSSFIISTKDVDYDLLKNVILKDFYIETQKGWNDESDEEIATWYKPEDIIDNSDGNIGLFIKTQDEINNEDYDYMWGVKPQEVKNSEEKFYVIDNNCTCRFDFDLVEKIFTNKYNIPWKYGECD